MKRVLLLALSIALCYSTTVAASKLEKNRNKVLSASQGYYKDIFMDGGIHLTSRRTLSAAGALSLTMDHFASAPTTELTATDTLLQRQIFCGYAEDTNGWLLYPDGAPRYRLIYVNGGSAAKHAISLTPEGRKHIQEFVAAGGSYLGTCAGAFLGSAGSKSIGKNDIRNRKLYLHLWPSIMHGTGLRKSYTAMRLEPKSPLLKYYDFGKDMIIDSVRHNGGGYALEEPSTPLPDGTEVLTRYVFENKEKVQINNQISAWAYKPNSQSGRTILIGSHPEGVQKGERRDYMAAMILYAMEANPQPKLKAELQIGSTRSMTCKTEDNSPDFTRIGDKQYHHFTISVPKKCQSITITLNGYKGEDNFDLVLCAQYGSHAFVNNSQFVANNPGCYKEITITNPKAGKWFVSVLCTTTVTAISNKYGTEYIKNTNVLNGVPYSITVK